MKERLKYFCITQALGCEEIYIWKTKGQSNNTFKMHTKHSYISLDNQQYCLKELQYPDINS